MKSSSLRRNVLLLSLPLVLAAVLLVIVGSGGIVTAGHEDMPPHGIVCTENASPDGKSAIFSLSTMTGTISLPDGNRVYMWGFSAGGDPFQHPSPTLCVTEGMTVTIVVNNTLDHDVSLIFPGQEDVLANGVPSTPVVDAGTGELISLAPVATANGGSMTYSFVASQPGTYLYESGTEPGIQVNMGLFGALVVRPLAGPNFAYNEVVVSGTVTYTTEFMPDEEFLLIFSEIDPMLHMAVEQGLPYDMNNYTSRYWNINGRSFPDTIAPNGAEWLPDQPYGSLIHINPFNDDPAAGDAYHPHPALIRYLSVGTENYPHHPHGNHGRIIARDGNVLIDGAGQDLSYERFTITLGPGQTTDEMFAWTDVEGWHPTENPIPVTIPQLQNLTFGTFYSGSPYLGATDLLPVGHQALNACGEYYHISHNHALQQITAWGVVLSGHITFTRIDPPLPNDCP
ncbi:MAG: multicopper oxidase domain-containing protein [Anaerolineae bacterium]|nr:multicopper oxidase domain-containing protein [Anaerolineae bacterium]